ncbi:hypothetical protein H6F67_15785 [Microcoleus sp. FACHB-1515]|nr:hypothetical protein [Microcoleus sp. FACHB-1515]MBD2091307.1 hypothetical protein [Microcoleus sp. FACHB-1515]
MRSYLELQGKAASEFYTLDRFYCSKRDDVRQFAIAVKRHTPRMPGS